MAGTYAASPSVVICTRFTSRSARSTIKPVSRAEIPRPDGPRDHQLVVGVHREPSPRVAGFRRGGFFACSTFFCFAYVKLQISSACIAPSLPQVAHVLIVVRGARLTRGDQQLGDRLMLTPVTRSMDRSDMPSTSRSIRCARLAELSLFICHKYTLSKMKSQC